MMKTYIIAEVGPNHNGSLDMAIEYIERLSETGVNAIKFQLGNPEETYSLSAFKAEYQMKSGRSESPIEMAKKHQLKPDDHKILYAKCNEKNVDYLCSAFDLGSLVFLDNNFDLKYFKIPSGEIFSLDMIEYISNINKPIILSTGMASYDEISISINLLNKKQKKYITLLHCISNYPTPFKDVNMNNMIELKRRFNLPVGFSDHTTISETSLAAVSMGATIIEKHVTLDRDLPGPDHKSSSTINEFKKLINSIRIIEQIKGSEKKYFSQEEIEISKAARKSIISKNNIAAGVIIKESDLCFKRPGTGILPINKNEVIGKKSKIDIKKNKIIKPEYLEK